MNATKHAAREGRSTDANRQASAVAVRSSLGLLLLIAMGVASFFFARWALQHLEPVHLPPVLVGGQLAIFLAGTICGLKLRDWIDISIHNHARDDDAGDTHAAFAPGEPASTQPPHTTRRVRAGPPPLPYSYDSRSKSARH